MMYQTEERIHQFVANISTGKVYGQAKEFGKDVWASMQPELEKAFRDKHPQRYEIKDGVRLK